ncbi:YbaK/EbsC family protein [Halobellus clavatus]|jgi:prolyl-tRNA editing enzyme YbaK/EbsC (Cys-tRNA(Pro) deacylase)|uniref:Cys-tRNA(Pro) deacylase, prolyl-tRNA editing enzyme YbaK/EbsC n=1 Tax=Halobellus clavatus TaxID=660517 RepID=A0A1H3GXK4_9EURY|nr:YbaK/EbsC family protein [Halobellus clavatus]SDY07800.1 Cys-tRNA(Pro) deacylase, prolyl-tRNA editing enzyme YbaK/EbsC [Halobellus clavatus]
MHARAREFADRARERYGLDLTIQGFPEGTETAADAAEAIGCAVGQIASSLVFAADGDLVVVVTSGANRVNESRLASHLGSESVSMAAPEEIKDVVGWSIGGVPPFCHDASLPVYVDETLLAHDTVWAAAGAPTAVFPIAPDELVELTDATVVDVC